MKPFQTPVANPENGEVLLELKKPNGDIAVTYVLRMKTNAICRLEQAMGDTIDKLEPRIVKPGMGDLRSMLFAALGDFQPELTLANAGDLIDRIGFDVCVAAVTEAMVLGFPQAVKGAAPVKRDPGKGPGTGSGSSSTRRKPASVPQSSGS